MTQPQAAGGGPLAGIRVVDLTQVVLGPFATQVLGDMGADVIKVEPPGGDQTRQIGPSRTRGMGSYYANLNRNKRSIVLDLKQRPAMDALWRLIEGADVFVHNMRIGAMERLGLGYSDVAARNPRIVYACATGFRQGSAMQESPAYDDLIQGISGMASLNAGPDGAPRYFPTVAADKVTGHVLASMIGMALFHRERTGQGQQVHVPMLETMLNFMLVEHFWHGTLGEPERGMGYPRMLTPYRRPFATKDGYLCVIAVSDAQWRVIFAAIGQPELMEDPRYCSVYARAQNVEAVYEILANGLTLRTTAEWSALLTKADVPNGPAHSLPELLRYDYLRETGFFSTQQHPAEGSVTVTAVPAAFSATPAAVRHLWPTLGQHTEQVLREAGLTDTEIAAAMGQ
jgi:crotonobetainyl-CoA:carnitine CoA-transferase CaiB-like acyl-CoA transferase